MTCLDFQNANLPNLRFFRFLKFLSYPSKSLCFSKDLEESKVSPSEGITAEQKIWKWIFVKNITSNDLFRLPERPPTQSSSFSIFEIFVLPIKICKALEASNVRSSEGIQKNRKFEDTFLPKISLQMTCLDFQRVNLPNPDQSSFFFRVLIFLSYLSKFLCFSKAREASKGRPSGKISAE